MYNKKVIEHFSNPQFVGELENPTAVGQEGNVKCGDIMKIFIKVENDIIEDIRFQTYGCVAAIATSDVLCGLAKDKHVDDALKIRGKDIVEVLGELPSIKHHCSVLGTEALENAINNYKGAKNGNK